MRFLSSLLTVLAVASLAVGAVALVGKHMFRATGPLDEPRIVEVNRGDSLIKIAETLEADGVISSSFVFRAAARIQGVAGGLQAGDYEIPAGASMRDILVMLTTGEMIDYRITIAEGLTVAEVLVILEGSEVLTGAIDEAPMEGMIAPETYFVRRGEQRQDVLDRMVAAQSKILAELWAARAPDLPIATPEEALILASIVEKETGQADERALVASVFVNRLIKGMRLQSDPTVIYGITGGEAPLGRGLRKSELRAPTPYNTYTIAALPPTPIANPGEDAIRATLNPAETEYYYFVADGTGGHAFARTLDEHNANVRRWRRIEAERKAASDG